VCAHLVTPSLGVDGTTILKPGQWSASVAFRYYNSRQDVRGDTPLDHPFVYANTHVYEFDLAATLAVTDRLSLTLDVPFAYGTRQTWIEHNIMSRDLHTMRAGGMGDPRIRADYWLLDPKKHPNQNFSLALGIKFPLGVDDAEDYSYRATGKVLRPVSIAIQPGDGGWGIILASHSFTSLYFPSEPASNWFKNTWAYADAIYIISPQELSDTHTDFADEPPLTAGGYKPLKYNSIADQFLFRLGVSQVIWPSKGLSVSAGVRWEGIPVYDLLGGSDGWRFAGNAVSFDPGVTWSHGNDSFSVFVPIAVHRHASRNVAFQRTGTLPGPGIATIADWQLILSYTRTF
jgi:hypothetical protein